MAEILLSEGLLKSFLAENTHAMITYSLRKNIHHPARLQQV